MITFIRIGALSMQTSYLNILAVSFTFTSTPVMAANLPQKFAFILICSFALRSKSREYCCGDLRRN